MARTDPPPARSDASGAGSVVGSVPGRSGASAFSHIASRSTPLPVLIAVPHAGRAYPPALLERMRDAPASQLRLEDRHVDALGTAIARETGTGLLVAHAPRAMLDLNRAPDDIDWGMVTDAGDRQESDRGAHAAGPNARARSGLGLVPRRLPGSGEIWRDRLTRAELKERIAQIHTPYHRFLTAELERIRDIWGAALLIDLHSMPPLRRGADGRPRAQVVLGDRFGATCHSGLVVHALRYLERNGCPAAHNRPYSGGYVLDRHSSVRHNIHALQVEVCRAAYLDDALTRTTPAMEPLAAMLAGLVRELGAQTARLGMAGQWPQAAE